MVNLNTIEVNGKVISLHSRSLETLYLVTLDEYIKETGTDINSLISVLSTEIQMLERARIHYVKTYRELPYLSDNTGPIGDLLSDLTKQIAAKTAKLNRYEESI